VVGGSAFSRLAEQSSDALAYALIAGLFALTAVWQIATRPTA